MPAKRKRKTTSKRSTQEGATAKIEDTQLSGASDDDCEDGESIPFPNSQQVPVDEDSTQIEQISDNMAQADAKGKDLTATAPIVGNETCHSDEVVAAKTGNIEHAAVKETPLCDEEVKHNSPPEMHASVKSAEVQRQQKQRGCVSQASKESNDDTTQQTQVGNFVHMCHNIELMKALEPAVRDALDAVKDNAIELGISHALVTFHTAEDTRKGSFHDVFLNEKYRSFVRACCNKLDGLRGVQRVHLSCSKDTMKLAIFIAPRDI